MLRLLSVADAAAEFVGYLFEQIGPGMLHPSSHLNLYRYSIWEYYDMDGAVAVTWFQFPIHYLWWACLTCKERSQAFCECVLLGPVEFADDP